MWLGKNILLWGFLHSLEIYGVKETALIKAAESDPARLNGLHRMGRAEAPSWKWEVERSLYNAVGRSVCVWFIYTKLGQAKVRGVLELKEGKKIGKGPNMAGACLLNRNLFNILVVLFTSWWACLDDCPFVFLFSLVPQFRSCNPHLLIGL